VFEQSEGREQNAAAADGNRADKVLHNDGLRAVRDLDGCNEAEEIVPQQDDIELSRATSVPDL
jgi:hypothetical protein